MNEQNSLDAIAGEYVLGTLTGSERAAFETRLETDSEAADAVAAWQRHLAPLDAVAEPADPPAGVWGAIKRRIAAEAGPYEHLTVAEGSGAWEPMGPGVAKKTLNFDEQTGARSYLVRYDPGATDQPHYHPFDEEIMMLSGDLSIDDLTLKAGDYHLARQGTWHGAAHSEAGGLLFVRDRAAVSEGEA